MTRAQLMVALDIDQQQKTLELVQQLQGLPIIIKVGLECFVSQGINTILKIQEAGFPIFLDLKLHDIPTTVAKTVDVITQMNVQYLTLHLSGGLKMVQEAQAVVKNHNTSLQLLGVTVLTSDSTEQAHRVKELAQIAVAADIAGIVCSPHEVVTLSQEPFKKLKKVTPGIRPEFFKSATDHQRFTTPAEAVRNGSDFLVVGRPITLSNDPRESCQKVLEEIYESCR